MTSPSQLADRAEMLYRLGLGYGARSSGKRMAMEQIHAMMPEMIAELRRLQGLDDEVVAIPTIDLAQLPLLIDRG